MAFFDNILGGVNKFFGRGGNEETPQPEAGNEQPMISTNQGVQPGYIQEAAPTVDTSAPAQIISPTIPTALNPTPSPAASIQTQPEPIFQTDAMQSTAPIAAPVQQELQTRLDETAGQAAAITTGSLENNQVEQASQELQQEANEQTLDKAEQSPIEDFQADVSEVSDMASKGVDLIINKYASAQREGFDLLVDKVAKPVVGFAASIGVSLEAGGEIKAIENKYNKNIATNLLDLGIESKSLGLAKSDVSSPTTQTVSNEANDTIARVGNIFNDIQKDLDAVNRGDMPAEVFEYNKRQKIKAAEAVMGSSFDGLTLDNYPSFEKVVLENEGLKVDAIQDIATATQEKVSRIQNWAGIGETAAQKSVVEQVDDGTLAISDAAASFVTTNNTITSRVGQTEQKRMANAIVSDYRQDLNNRLTPVANMRSATDKLRSTMDSQEVTNRDTWVDRVSNAVVASNKRNEEWWLNYTKQLTIVGDPDVAEQNATDAIVTKYGVSDVKARADEPIDAIGLELGVMHGVSKGEQTTAEKINRLSNYYMTTTDFGGSSLNVQQGGKLYGWFDNMTTYVENLSLDYIKPQLRQGLLGGNFSFSGTPLEAKPGSLFAFGYLQSQQQSASKKTNFDDTNFLENFIYSAQNYSDDVTLAAVSIVGPGKLAKLARVEEAGNILRIISSNALRSGTFRTAGYMDTAGDMIWQLGPINRWYGGLIQSYIPEDYTVNDARFDIGASMLFDGIAAIRTLRRFDGLFGLVAKTDGAGNTVFDAFEAMKSIEFTRQRASEFGRTLTPEEVNRVNAAYIASANSIEELIKRDLEANNGEISTAMNSFLKNILFTAERAKIMRSVDMRKGGSVLTDVYSSDIAFNADYIERLKGLMTPSEKKWLDSLGAEASDPNVLIGEMINKGIVKYKGDTMVVKLGGYTQAFDTGKVSDRLGLKEGAYTKALLDRGIAPDYDYISKSQLSKAKSAMKNDNYIRQLSGAVVADPADPSRLTVDNEKLNGFIDGLFIEAKDGYIWADDAFEKLQFKVNLGATAEARKEIIKQQKTIDEINDIVKENIQSSAVPQNVKDLVANNAYGNMFQAIRKTFTSDIYC